MKPKKTKTAKTTIPTQTRKIWHLPTPPYKPTKAERENYLKPDSVALVKADLLNQIGLQLTANGFNNDIINLRIKDAFKGTDNYIPDPALVDEVIDAWNKMPDEVRRRMVNGWPGELKDIQSARSLFDENNHDISRVLAIVASSPRTIYSEQEYALADDGWRIAMKIPFGTSKQDALDAIAGIRSAIISDWDKMMVAADTHVTTTVEVPTVDPEAPRDISYSPELAAWERGHVEGNTVNITDDNDINRAVATLTINPQFGAEAIGDISRFISYAPDVWRMLRRVLELVSFNADRELFSEAQALLWESCGRFPFAFPEVDADEERMMIASMDRDLELSNPEVRSLMKSHGITVNRFGFPECPKCHQVCATPSAAIEHVKLECAPDDAPADSIEEHLARIQRDIDALAALTHGKAPVPGADVGKIKELSDKLYEAAMPGKSD